MGHFGRILLIFLFAVGLGGIAYWQIKSRHAEEAAVVASAPTPEPKPAVQYPVVEPPAEETEEPEEAPAPAPAPVPAPALPVKAKPRPVAAAPKWTTLDASLTDLFGAAALSTLFRNDELVRNVVITVTEESSKKLPGAYIPWKSVPGTLRVTQGGEGTILSPENSKRYEPYLKALEAVSAKRLVATYAHFYPAFQQAYQETGNKDYFNDKVVAALDDMLAAPEPKAPLALEQPEVFFKFADENLETLSAGQKLMVRVGAENEHRLKMKLRELRSAVTRLGKRMPQK